MLNIGSNLSLLADSVDIQREEGSDWYQLVVAQNGDDVQEIHEVMGGHFTQSVLFNSIFQKALTDAGVPAVDLLRLLSRIQNEANRVKSGQESLSEAVDNCGGELDLAPDEIPGALAAALENALAQLVLGGDQFLQVQWTYRRSFMYAERIWQSVDASVWAQRYRNVEAIHTETQLQAAEDIPASLYLPKAVGCSSAIASGAAAAAGDTCEWLKQAPNITLSYNQKRAFTIEYLAADKWSRLLYPLASLT